MIKRQSIRFFIVLQMILFLSGCAFSDAAPEKKQYQATFLDLFNTVTTIVGSAESEEIFHEQAQGIYDELLEYHQLFDIYNEYDGFSNICTINKNAGIAPVKVDSRIVELLLDCQEFSGITNGRVNVAMGSVLELWHEARTESLDDPRYAYLPEEEKLTEASKHTSIEALVVDPEECTVYLTDPDMALDVGAVAKGWATQRVAENVTLRSQKNGNSGFLISVGGNVCATGPKDGNQTPWVIGIQDPDDALNSYLHTVYVKGGCVVTSGDYQRTYAVDGKLYHHIIDPDTLFPSEYWRSVTIICEDSGIADMLSTALFLMDRENGQKLLDQYGALAMWVDYEGDILYSPGFEDLIRT